jgi:hypothetical protein
VGVRDGRGVGGENVFVGSIFGFATRVGVSIPVGFAQETSVNNRRKGNIRFIKYFRHPEKQPHKMEDCFAVLGRHSQ